MSKNICNRCGGEIEEPISTNASYVRASDITDTDTVEVVKALVHTEESRAALEQLQQEYYPQHAVDDIERTIARGDDIVTALGPPQPASGEMPSDERVAAVRQDAPARVDFDEVEVADVADAPDGTIHVQRTVETRGREKTALVHESECEKDGDERIW
jgi:hypothetical protein